MVDLWTFIISMLPIGELRFSIPFGVLSGLNWFDAFLYSVFGNSLITVILLFLINYYKIKRLKELFSKIPLVGSVFNKWENSSIKKSDKINKWGYMGLAGFVSIPLPITGAWTAVLISAILDLKPLKTFIAIVLGLIISGSIVTFISVNFDNLLEYIFINKEDINNFLNYILQ